MTDDGGAGVQGNGNGAGVGGKADDKRWLGGADGAMKTAMPLAMLGAGDAMGDDECSGRWCRGERWAGPMASAGKWPMQGRSRPNDDE